MVDSYDFLQSDQWRLFQEKNGRKSFLVRQGFSRASSLVHLLPFVGRYVYVPHGPVFDVSDPSSLPGFFDELFSCSISCGAGWIRVDPLSQEHLSFLFAYCARLGYSFVRASHDMQPKSVFVVDLNSSQEDLFASMKSKTRYNIRLAQKKGVEIVVSREKKNIDSFCDLVEQTARRKKVRFHSREYYLQMIESFSVEEMVLYSAFFDGQIVASALIVFFDGRATYLHGASSDRYRNVMAPHLLHWKILCDAKERGCSSYDLGGVTIPGDEHTASLAEVTRFKMGFSSSTEPVVYPGTYDIILSPLKYRVYLLLSWLRSFV
ncbi:MAG: peptidoglycan bridge formation glycyltransferase FemA/FemB family protein [Candidatus Moranbacteria bacterium]|nr:peptidoglycan bridge formation glycyltransferase FemA/FemB family protein [Candidatus Moranbacteria bacterium]